jgi:hypothetical protein
VGAAVRIAVSREVEADTVPFGQEMTFLVLEHTSDQADDLSFSCCSERPFQVLHHG